MKVGTTIQSKSSHLFSQEVQSLRFEQPKNQVVCWTSLTRCQQIAFYKLLEDTMTALSNTLIGSAGPCMPMYLF